MPSTYSSNLKIELMATGENSGTWGTITNSNLGTALEQAIVGYGNPDFASDANLTISITNSTAAQAARALVLNVTSSVSLTATRELVVPTIEKQYIVQNNTTGGQSITVKTSAGTGITVPNGRKAHLYVDGTNVIQMFDYVDINGGTIDGTPIGSSSASSGAFTTLNASGATTLDGSVALGNASGDLITVPGTVNSNLVFTDNSYDIGASGATRPRNLYLANNAVIGNDLSVGGTLTLTGGLTLNGNVTVGDSSADTLTINSTITSNLIFTDNTYDIGASGATRPRNLYLSNNLVVGGAQTLTGALTVDSTTDSTSTTTGSIQTDGGIGVVKSVYVGGTLTIDSTTDSSSTTTGSLQTDGGAGIVKNLYVGGNALIGTATNTNSSSIVANGTISETVGGTQYLVASQYDIGTDPNQIPLNQYLGNLAYQDAGSIAGNVVIGGTVTSAGITSTGPSVISVNSTSDALRITQTGTGNALVVEDSANPDSTPFVVDANGRVLSGLTTPITTLFGNTPGVQINAQFGVQALAFSRFSANQFGADIDFVKSRNATIGSQAVLVSGDQIANLNFAGSDGTNFIAAGAISAAVDGTPGTNDMPGRLVFSTTADGASSPTERMRIDSAGSVGIGSAAAAGETLRVSKQLTGSTSAFGVYQVGTVQAGVTSSVFGFRNIATTAAASFTLGSYFGFQAIQTTIGAGSTITNQYGFHADSTLTGATNNYGFFSNIASGTGRWNFYAAGTAANYFAGQVGIGASSPSTKLHIYDADPVLLVQDSETSLPSSDARLRLAESGVGGALGNYYDLRLNGGNFTVDYNTTELFRIASDGNVTFKNAITETVATLGTSGTIALNPASGTIQTCAAAGTITFTDSLSSGQSISLRLTSGSSFTINWPTITWVTSAGNVAPTLTANDTLVFWKISTTLYGAYVGSGA